MASKQSVLDKWFLRQDIINQLLESGEESEDALKFAERIMPVVEAEESEYQSLEDPFDRSVAWYYPWLKIRNSTHGTLIYRHF